MKHRELRIIVDTREKVRLPFPRTVEVNKVAWTVRTEAGGLPTGDYSIVGYGGRMGEHWGITIERKKDFGELCGNLGKNRDRFVRELLRMSFYQCRYLVVEQHQDALWSGAYRGLMEPEHMFAQVRGLTSQFQVPMLFCDGREEATKAIVTILRQFAAREEFCRSLDERRVERKKDSDDPRDQVADITKRDLAGLYRRLASLEVAMHALASDLA